MDLSRVVDVLEICLPVFAVMGVGKWLGLKSKLTQERCDFINWLVYTFSLPSLILNAVSRQTFKSFLDPALVVAPLVALLLVAAVTMLIAKLSGFKGGVAAAFVFGTFWANATYIGFPLSINAFGDAGEAKAAVYNGFVMPFFIVFGYLLIGMYGAGNDETKMGQRVKGAFLNPILISAAVGVGVALLADQFRNEAGLVQLPEAVLSSASIVGATLKLVGAMGLPLALLSIGASLKWEGTKTHLAALGWTIGCKLILLPLVTLLLIQLFLPQAAHESLGVAVILASTPSAVASYVISCQVGIDRSFVATMLVVSTGLSVLTIPVWVYVVMGLAQ
jgi:malonate transporter and related proteins